MSGRYDDIINTPYPAAKKRRRMTQRERAAQFASFAALSGYEEAVAETARLTSEKADLDECEMERLNSLILVMSENPGGTYAVTYFLPDKRKSGGSYECAEGALKEIDEVNRLIIMKNGVKIPIFDIYDIEIKE